MNRKEKLLTKFRIFKNKCLSNSNTLLTIKITITTSSLSKKKNSRTNNYKMNYSTKNKPSKMKESKKRTSINLSKKWKRNLLSVVTESMIRKK